MVGRLLFSSPSMDPMLRRFIKEESLRVFLNQSTDLEVAALLEKGIEMTTETGTTRGGVAAEVMTGMNVTDIMDETETPADGVGVAVPVLIPTGEVEAVMMMSGVAEVDPGIAPLQLVGAPAHEGVLLRVIIPL